jgi:hypothetical protein
MNKGAIIADIAVAVMAAVCLIFGWGGDGMLHKVALIWGGMSFGYIITTYLNLEDL